MPTTLPRVYVIVNISSMCSKPWEADLMDAADEYRAANVGITIINPYCRRPRDQQVR